MRTRQLVIGALVLASTATLGLSTAGARLPSTATKIGLAPGDSVSGVDGHLQPAASIAGTVTAGGVHHFVVVAAYLGGRLVDGAVADGVTGHYLIGGLRASTVGYDICVRGDVSGGSSITGYEGQCYTTAVWSGGAIPASAHELPLTSSQHRTGVNITLPSAAAIAGRVTNPAGAGIGNAAVHARNRSDGQMYFAQTDGAGRYKLLGLTSSSAGYTVCFDPRYTTGGPFGYLPRCYRNVAWDGGAIPSAAAAVNVTLGSTHGGISQVMRPAGAISGTVTEAGTGDPVPFETINVYNSAGVAVASGYGSPTGQYIVKGLPAGTAFRVCATVDEFSSALAHAGQCWKNVAWGGGALPSGTTPVDVTLRHTHSGIDFVVPKVTTLLGSITGTVTEQAGGQPLQSATAELHSSTGEFKGSVSTDADGHYTFGFLRPSAIGYTVCVTAGSAVSTTPMPATGWAPRCYGDVNWDSVSPPPASATKVPISPGEERTGVDVAVHLGGAVQGTVHVAGSVTPIPDVYVELFTPSRLTVATAYTAVDGSYAFTAVAPLASPAGYIICFDGSNLVGVAGYLPQCFNRQPWNGFP